MKTRLILLVAIAAAAIMSPAWAQPQNSGFTMLPRTGVNFPAQLRFDAFGNRSATGGTDSYDPTDFQYAGQWGYQTEFASANFTSNLIERARYCLERL